MSQDAVSEVSERICRALLGDARKVDCDIIESHIRELLCATAPEPQSAIGVGDGSGALFVHGSYEAIRRVRSFIFDAEKWRTQSAVPAQDTARLDFLDRLNAGLNQHYGTEYGWELIQSPNIVRLMSGPGGRGRVAAIDLNDSKARGAKSCRAVIDDAMKRSGEQKA
ncbi:hypothetical protein [Cupriavidus pauculus]|uniref:hypothetical protein n=1 Tax=Cupriavidus pauculus TaxID=82633 RepID=UPI0030F72A50